VTERITVQGHDIAVATLGQGPAPMVMIHCSLANHRSLARLARYFAQTHTIRLIDMPGHGNSGPWDGAGDVQGVVAEAAAMVAEPGAFVFGHSFGATAALRMAVDHPGRAGRLALYEPVYFTPIMQSPEYAAYLDRFRPFTQAMAAEDHTRAAELFNDQWGRDPWERIPGIARRDMAARIWFIMASERAFEGDIGQVFAPGRLDALACETLLMMGGKSEPIMPHVMDELARRVPNARLETFADLGHMGPVTDPEVIARAMGA